MNNPELIRVVLVDDQQQVHDAVTTILHQNSAIRLVAESYNGSDALQLCEMVKPDLILMDIVMPGMDGIATTRAIREQYSHVKVLVLSSFHEYDYIREMLEAGAHGYLVKSALATDLVPTILNTFSGNMVLSPEVARQVITPPKQGQHFHLTERELTVLSLIGQGMTDSQIAVTLKISAPTVRFHFNNMLHKFEVETRAEMLVIAAKHDLI